MVDDLRTQFNVIKALAVHSLQGKMSAYNYGFAWVILEPLLFIAAFRLLRKALGGMASPSSMTPLMFYILGVFPIYMCFDALKAATSAMASTSRLLTFPRVTKVDLAIAGALSSFCIYFLLFWVIAVPVSLYEQVWPPDDIIPVIFSMTGCWVIGIGLGFLIGAALRVFPPARQFVGYITFGMRFASGMFFCITMIPEQYWPYLTWNPILHLVEFSRDGWFESYVSPVASAQFVFICMIGIMLLSLSLERFMRRVPQI